MRKILSRDKPEGTFSGTVNTMIEMLEGIRQVGSIGGILWLNHRYLLIGSRSFHILYQVRGTEDGLQRNR
jgi:hypothetical protein